MSNSKKTTGTSSATIVSGSNPSELTGNAKLIASTVSKNTSPSLYAKFAMALLPSNEAARLYLIKNYAKDNLFSGATYQTISPLLVEMTNASRRWVRGYANTSSFVDPEFRSGHYTIFNGVSNYVADNIQGKDAPSNIIKGWDNSKVTDSLLSMINSLSEIEDFRNIIGRIVKEDANNGSTFGALWYFMKNDPQYRTIFNSSFIVADTTEAEDVNSLTKVADNFNRRYVFDIVLGIIYAAISDAATTLLSRMGDVQGSDILLTDLLDETRKLITSPQDYAQRRFGKTNSVFKGLGQAISSVYRNNDDVKTLVFLSQFLEKSYQARETLKTYFQDASSFNIRSKEKVNSLLSKFKTLVSNIASASDTSVAQSAIRTFLETEDFNKSISGVLYAQLNQDQTLDPEQLDFLTEVLVDAELLGAYNSSAAAKFFKAEILEDTISMVDVTKRGMRYKLSNMRQQSLSFNDASILTEVSGIETSALLGMIGTGEIDKRYTAVSQDYFNLLAQFAMVNEDLRRAISSGSSASSITSDYQFSQNIKNDSLHQFKQIEAAVVIDFAIFRLANKLWALDLLSTINDALVIQSTVIASSSHSFVRVSELDKVQLRNEEIRSDIKKIIDNHFPGVSIAQVDKNSGVVPDVEINRSSDPIKVSAILNNALIHNASFLSLKDTVINCGRILDYSSSRKKSLAVTGHVHDLNPSSFTEVERILLTTAEDHKTVKVNSTSSILITGVQASSFEGKMARSSDKASYSFFEPLESLISDVNNISSDWNPKGLQNGVVFGHSQEMTKMPSVVMTLVRRLMTDEMQNTYLDDRHVPTRLNRLFIKCGPVITGLLKLSPDFMEGSAFDMFPTQVTVSANSVDNLKEVILNNIGLTAGRVITSDEYSMISVMLTGSSARSNDFPFALGQRSWKEGMILGDAIRMKNSYVDSKINGTLGHYVIFVRNADLLQFLMSDVIVLDNYGGVKLHVVTENSLYFGKPLISDLYINVEGETDTKVWEPLSDGDSRGIALQIATSVRKIFTFDTQNHPSSDDAAVDDQGSEEETAE